MNAGRIPLEPGHRLDRYELLCPIAHGGMASVWLARFVGKHGFEKLVAIKTILPEYAADTRFQQMFLDEARIASGIEHVNVAQILDLGEQHEVLYIVMEWVDGDSLSKLHRSVEARGARVPLGVTLRLLADACGGSARRTRAHRQNRQIVGRRASRCFAAKYFGEQPRQRQAHRLRNCQSARPHIGRHECRAC